MTSFEMESDIEAHLVDVVERRGGKCLKWVCPGHRGVPDRIVFLPGGAVWFIELKRPNGRASALQKYWARIFNKYELNYVILWSNEQIDAWNDQIEMVKKND